MISTGHWRTLKPNQIGRDQFGSAIYGKTWVDRKSKKKPTPPPEILFRPKPIKDNKKSPAEIDLDLWNSWKKSGSKEDLSVLMHRFDGTVAKSVYMFKGYAVPESVIEAAAYIALKKALENYDPTKGANINTFVTQYVRKVGQFVGKYSNMGKIPENRRLKIPAYTEAKKILFERMGHEPDAKTLATYLKWDMKEITRMETELGRRDLVASQMTEPDVAEGLVLDSAEDKTSFRAVYLALDDSIERLVFEYTSGYNGKKELSPSEISKKLKIHPSKVSRIKKKINNMFLERGV